jgi:hypothetical protein
MPLGGRGGGRLAECRLRLDRGGARPRAANRFICDGGNYILAYARRANIPVHIVPAPGKPGPDEPDSRINNVYASHDRLNARRRLRLATPQPAYPERVHTANAGARNRRHPESPRP